MPRAHVLHVLLPVLSENWPAPQGSQAVAPTSLLCVPAGHLENLRAGRGAACGWNQIVERRGGAAAGRAIVVRQQGGAAAARGEVRWPACMQAQPRRDEGLTWWRRRC